MAHSAIVKEWDTNTPYILDEMIYTSDDPEISIQYHNQSYRCKEAHTSISFGTDFGNGRWEQMRGTRGTDGLQGTKGNIGDVGPIGPQGPSGANGGNGADGLITAIATKAEVEAGVENTKAVTSLRTQENFDFNILNRDASIATNTANINTNITNIATNVSDIAAISIDSAQISTNQNDIAGQAIVDANLQSQIDAIADNTAQVNQNTTDIATINNTSIPDLQDQINSVAGRVSSLESNFQLSNASGKQELKNNQLTVEPIIGDAYGTLGLGSSWELNSIGAKSARVRAEIYRKDDAEERLTVAMLEMHFLEATNTWFLGRTWTTAFSGNPDGVVFSVSTVDLGGGIFVGNVGYTSGNMVGGNYSNTSYVKFLLEEISNL